MTIGRAFPDLLTPLSSAASVEEGLAQTLGRLVELTGAAAGAPVFTPPHEAPIVGTAGGRRPPPGPRPGVGARGPAPPRRGGGPAPPAPPPAPPGAGCRAGAARGAGCDATPGCPSPGLCSPSS